VKPFAFQFHITQIQLKQFLLVLRSMILNMMMLVNIALILFDFVLYTYMKMSRDIALSLSDDITAGYQILISRL